MSLPDDLLERPAGESARLVVLDLLEQGHEASKRLSDPMDVEALHDFRVAIRRARAALEAWSDRLPKKAKLQRRELTRLQRTTGAARDAEVAIEWMNAAREGSSPDALSAIDWLIPVLEAERTGSYDLSELAASFEAARIELIERVRMMGYDLLGEAKEETYAEAVGARAQARFADLVALLADVAGPNDAAQLHEARIAGKRLRYLLEPIAEKEPLATQLVERLKGLQDLLGELHDAHVLADRIAVLRIEIDDFTLRTSIDSMRARCVARAVGLHRRLMEEWLAGGLDRAREDVDHLANALATRKSLEVERKYLLSRMPDLPSGAEALEIEQGYVPGKRLHERVRRVRREGSVQYYRTIKLGMGVQRIEIEEETTQAIFETLWSLTIGHRVTKRRYLVQEESATWEIDQFLDRDLVLAEIELASPDETPRIPDWLKPTVVEDVTERSEFTNLALAR
jgi:CHAD domain-containing protein/CYTH domain-containing protein